MPDELEQYGNDIATYEGVNIAVEKVSDGYQVCLARMGEPRQFFRMYSPVATEAFLDGVTAGITMMQATMLPDREPEEYMPPEFPDDIMEKVAQMMSCPECDSTMSQPWLTPAGTWRIEVVHDPLCLYALNELREREAGNE